MKAVVFRFPLELFCAATGTALALWEIDHENSTDTTNIRLILCSILGLVLFLSASVFSESRGLKKQQRSLVQVGVVLLLLASWFAINPIDAETSIIRYAMLAVSFHLVVSFSPKTSISGFWEYNKQLFLRILLSGIYSGVLFIGLSVALASTDFLFNLGVDYKNYARLWVLIIGLFNTFFFLAGVPQQFTNLQEQYPKGLKVFTQYVLIPLAIIYVCIILAYETKVLVEWSLPKGIISWLILGYAVYGILSILLVYPVRLLAENKWISTYSRWFYFLIIPLLPLLSVAIGLRIEEYGFTELRYSVVVLALWLTGISGYFLISKKYNIKLIPISLSILALFSAWGPQSASSVSERSQFQRLVSLFEREASFKNGEVVAMPVTIADSIGNEVVSQLRFINERYGTASLVPILPIAIRDSLLRTDTISNKYTKRYAAFDVIRKGLNLKSFYSSTKNVSNYYNASSNQEELYVAGYEVMRSVDLYNLNKSTVDEFVIDSEILRWATKEDTLKFGLTGVLNRIEGRAAAMNSNYLEKIDSEAMSVESNKHTAKNAKVVVKRISFTHDSTERQISELSFYLLYTKKQ